MGDGVEILYRFSMDSKTGCVSISEVIDSEFDDIYSVGRLFESFLKSLGYDEDIIEKIMKVENL